MRVLHVDMGKEWRGGQRQCLLLHEGLLKAGVDSHLVCREGYEFARRTVANSCAVRFRGEISPTSYKSLKKIIKELKPDIVHSHDASSLTPLVLMRLFGAKFHLINTRRVDFSVKKNLTSLYKYKNKFVNLVAVSQGVKAVLLKDGIRDNKVHVIYDGVPEPVKPTAEEVNSLKREFNITNNWPVVGTAANFAPHKDYPTLIKAYKLYADRYPDSRLLLAGEGPLFEEMKTLCHELSLSDKVVFTGFRTDIIPVVDCMDIYAVSSYLEGLNTSIIDAMFLGKPVVATDTGGIPELVQNNATGVLVPPYDYEAFAEQLILLTETPEKLKEFGSAAVDRAKGFTSEIMTERYIHYYRGLMK